ncbi:MAG TPA: hypothetical protein VIO56_01055 [Methylotenera sp.]
MVTKVIFVGRATAETTPGWGDWAVVSITEPGIPGEAKLMPGWHSICRVHFHDVDPNIPCGEPHVLMNEADGLKITQFVREVAPGVDGILVHCKAGVSRSAAVAKWIARQFDVPFNHTYDHYNKYVFDMLVKADKQRHKPLFTLAGKDDITILDTHIQKEPDRVINDWCLVSLEASGKIHLVGTLGSDDPDSVGSSCYSWVSPPVLKVDLDCYAVLVEGKICIGLGERKAGYPVPIHLSAIERYSRDYAQALGEFLGPKE